MRNEWAVIRLEILAGLLAVLTRLCVWGQSYAPPAPGDFGASGSFSVAVNTFTNPSYPASTGGDTLMVSVYHGLSQLVERDQFHLHIGAESGQPNNAY